MNHRNNLPFDVIWNFSALVLSGGGVRGIATLGALILLQEHGCLEHVNVYSGTSIGALLAALLSIGYEPDELNKEIWDINLNDLRSVDLWNFLNNFGLDTGNKITDTLKDLFRKKNINKDITFGELYKNTGKTLILTGTLVNKHKLEIFSHKTHPKCKIIDAVRISISIPFLFSSPKYENNYYSDGGILNNYPISCLEEYINKEDHVIGINLMHEFSMKERVQINTKDFPTFSKHLVYTAIEEINRLRNLLSKYECSYKNISTIEINTEGIGSIPINITDDNKKKLFSLGQYYTACWLEEYIDKKRQLLIDTTPEVGSILNVEEPIIPIICDKYSSDEIDILDEIF
jgi:predicted acylesterase/phospholipase RssA